MDITFINFFSPSSEYFSSYFGSHNGVFCSLVTFFQEAPKTLPNDSCARYDTAHAGTHNPHVPFPETVTLIPPISKPPSPYTSMAATEASADI